MKKIYAAILKNYGIPALMLSVFFSILTNSKVTAQTRVVTFSSTGNGTWTAPCGVTSITVQAWGGGGAGGGTGANTSLGGGGGAGGTYVSSVLPVIPGTTYNLSVGAGATGGLTAGPKGGSTWFNTNTTLLAPGGNGGAAPNGGTVAGGVGSTAGAIGTPIAGVSGSNGTTTVGGAGGAGGNGGGAGGAQIDVTGGNGNPGFQPGGGGGGAFVNNNINRLGGNGGNGQIIITYTGGLSYCIPSFSTGIRPITNVTFAGINNSVSSPTLQYEAFCGVSGNVVQGSTYPISVTWSGSTFTYNVRVYIDWNQNGILGDVSNEIYNVGSSVGAGTITNNTVMVVPATATLGTTIMRVINNYNGYIASACDASDYGQAEDYVLNVISPATISTSAITGSPFCVTPSNSSSVSVDFTSVGTFTGNTYTAQLSSAAGSFAAPTAIGTLVSNANSGTISAAIPTGTATAAGYRIRVISNSPAATGTNNGTNLTINLSANSIAPVAIQNINAAVNGTTLTATESTGVVSREWFYGTVSGGPYGTGTGITTTTFTPNFATQGIYYVVCVSTYSCGSITSNQVQINVAATVATSAISGSPFCVTASTGAAVSVPFTSAGTFTGNSYSAQLSSATGVFPGTNIGTLVSNANSGTISATIPAGTATGAGYRIRVISNSPAATGTDNGTNLTINLSANSIAPVAIQNINAAVNGTLLTVTESIGVVSREWFYGTVSGGPYGTGTGITTTTFTPNFASQGTYYVVCVSTYSCGSITSNQVQINVAATVSTSAISGSPFCVTPSVSASVSVPFTSVGTFTGNTYTAQLSSATGVFPGTNIGTLVSNSNSGTISATIPAGTATGAGYRIRVISNSPAATGTDNGTNLTINLSANSIAPVAIQNINATVNGTLLTATESTGVVSREWFYGTVSTGPYGTATGITTTTFTPNFATQGTYYVVCVSTYSCGSITSNQVQINVAATVATSAISGSPFCVTSVTSASVSVDFTSVGTFTGNTYTAQLSNALGSFAAPTTIGTLVSNANSGTISATIPAGTAAGAGYRIRVISNSPAATGTNNGTNLAIVTPTVNIGSAMADICEQGTSAALGGSIGGSANGGLWSDGGVNGNFNPTATTLNATWTAPVGFTGTAVLTLTTTGGACSTSGSKNILVKVAPVVTFITMPTGDICAGTNVTYTTQAGQSGYTWTYTGLLGTDYSIISGAGTNSVTIRWITPGTKTVTVNYTSNGCSALTVATTNNFVNARPTATITSGNTAICNPGTTNITGNVTAIGVWTVTITGGLTATGTGNGTFSIPVSPVINTTYSISGLVDSKCTATAGDLSGSTIVTVNQPVNITTQPNPVQTKCASFSATFTVVAGGDVGGYQWSKDGSPIVGATSATYSIPSVTTGDAGIYTVHVTGVGACAPGLTSANAQLIVNEDIVIQDQPTATQSLCAYSTATFYIGATGTGLTYQWRKNGTPILDGGTISGTQTATLQIMNIVAGDAGNYDVILNSVSGACQQKFSTIAALVVKPLPVASATVTPASRIICSNTVPNIALNSSIAGSTFNWTVVQTGVIGAIDGSGSTISQTLAATGYIAGTATYTIIPTANGCDGTAIIVTITVNPIATATATPASQPICSGISITPIDITGTVASTTFNWVRNNPGVTGIANSGTGNISGSLTNNTANPIVVTFTITPTANGCASATPTLATVTVNPTPALSTTLTPAGICNNATFSYAPASATTGATFSWTRAAVAGISNAAVTIPVNGSISEALNNTTNAAIPVTYIYTISANGCSNTQNVIVSVNPTATISPTIADQSICSETSFTTINPAGPVVGASYNWSWTASGSVTTTLPTSGTGTIPSTTINNNISTDVDVTFTVTPVINGCNGTPATFKITVKAKPTVAASIANQNICFGTPTAAIASILITNPNGVSSTVLSWTRDNPVGLSTTMLASGTGNVPAIVMTNTGLSTIVVTFTITAARNGCSSTTTSTVTLYAKLVAPVVTDDQTVCAGATPNPLNGTAATGGNGIYNYQWQSSPNDANPWTNIVGQTTLIYPPPAVALFGAQNIFYRLVTTTSCGIVNSNSVQIQPNNTYGITFNTSGNPTTPLCPGSGFTFSISGIVFGTIKYSWSADPLYISPASGGPVGGQPFISTANIPFTTINNTNAPVTTTITVTPTLGDLSGNPKCTGTAETFDVTINPTPSVNDPADIVVCNGDLLSSTLFTGNVTATGIAYTWVRTGGNIGLAATTGTNSIPSFTATNATTTPITGTFTVTPRFTNPSGGPTCSGTPQTFTITVNPTPVVANIASQTVCNGSSTTPVTFSSNTLPSGNNTFSWTNNNTSIGLAASGTGNIAFFTATNSGTVPVTATITVTPYYNNTANCPGASKQFTITVNPTPTSILGADATTVCYNTGTNINFTGTANAILTYKINSGGNLTIPLNAGGTATLPTGNLIAATTYTLVSIAFPTAPICSTAIPSQSITINVNPVASATISAGVSPICNGQSSSIIFTGTPNTIVTYNPGGATVTLDGAGTATVAVSPTSTTIYQLTSIAYPSAPTCIQNLAAIPSVTIVVSPDANAGTLSGTPTSICIGATTTYSSNGDAGGTWSSDNTLIATVNSSGVVTGVAFGNANIIYTVNSGCNAPKFVSKPVTVNADANAGTIIGLASLCYPTNYQYFSSGNSGGTWSSSNTGIATIDPSTGVLSAFGFGTTDIAYTVNSGCNAPKSVYRTISINPIDLTVGAISGSTQVCNGTNNLTYFISPLISATSYTWSLPAGWSFVSGQGTASIVVNTTSTGGIISVTATSLCVPISTPSSLLVNVTTSGTWLGITANWNDLGNWCGGILPTAATNVVIPNIGIKPVISGATALAKDITIAAGATLTITGQTLEISGALTSANTGSVSAGNGTIDFKGTAGVQTISGNMFLNKTLQNLTVSNPTGLNVSATNDTLNITGELAFGNASAVLNTNNNITLKSNSTNTANVGVLAAGNSIVGNVIVERYLSNARKWRLLSAPTNNVNQTIRNSWQENGADTLTLINYGFLAADPRYTIGTTYGFDLKGNNSSVKKFNPATEGWDAVANTNVLPISTELGYIVFVAGDRRITYPGSNATTLRTKGTLNAGLQSPAIIDPNKFGIVGNPYASRINLTKLTMTGIVSDTAIYVWDPSLGGAYGLGSFNTFYKDVDFNYKNLLASPLYGNSGSIHNYIESGAAFLVKAGAAGGSVGFNEDCKTSGSIVASFTSGTPQGIRVNLNLAGTTPLLLDGVMANFDETYSNLVDDMDIRKMSTIGESVALKTSNTMIVIERRFTVAENDTLHLDMTKMTVRNYQWEINSDNMDFPGRQAFFIDRYLNTSTPLNLAGTTTVNFSIQNIPGSYAPDRFKIVFKVLGTVPVTITSVAANRNSDKTVAVQWKVQNELNLTGYEVQRSTDGINFTTIITQTPDNNNGGSASYVALDRGVVEGTLYYRIKANSISGQVQYSAIVKVAPLKANPVISVYPNPVIDKTVHLQLKDIAAGTVYKLQLLNKAGQLIFTQSMRPVAGNSVETIQLNSTLTGGQYHLIISDESGYQTKIILFVK